MARTCDRIYDVTSASAGSLDTGALSVSRYNEGLIIVAITAGGAGASSYTASIYDDASPQVAVPVKTLTAPGVAATTLDSWCVGGSIASPCPDFARFQITAGAASTVRLIVHGVGSGIGT